MDRTLPTVAIVGRPNVGKSTLFNRLIQKRVSIMHDIEGVTRDRIYHSCEWLGRKFNLIDSGGFSRNLNLSFQTEINTQVEIAINEADLIIFLVSATDGPTKEDMVVASKLKKVDKPVLLTVNKSDNIEMSIATNNFYSLGMGEPIPISSIHGIGISDLLDQVIKNVKNKETSKIFDIPKIGIVGKPNVGKSTLVNSLLNDDRTIVSDVSGTTRDAIDTLLKFDGKEYILTDTAGLKKNKQALDDIEWYAELRTQLTILNSDITVLLIDKNQEVTSIDEKIMGILKEEYRPVIVAVNKIDLLTMDERNEVKNELIEKFKFASWVPIMFISAKDKKNIHKLMQKIQDIDERRKIDINKSSLNEFLMEIQMIKKPPRHNGINVKLSYITFSNNKFPHFIIFSNYPQYVHFSYVRFLENQLRNVFNLEGIPIKISIKGGKNNGRK